MFVMAPTKLI